MKTRDETFKRLLAMHRKSGVGHVGGNLSALEALWVLYHKIMGEADRFVLSKGHAAGAFYAVLWSIGRLTDADLDRFHADGTSLAGHPPAKGLPDSLFATGSLGHGLSLAAGMALALRERKAQGRVFCLMSDGEWQEGSNWEALIFAAHQKLSNLVAIVDGNGLQGFGSTGEVASMDGIVSRLETFGWAVETVEDGHDLAALEGALQDKGQGAPRLLFLKTRKGNGVPAIEGRLESHYLPLSEAAYLEALAQVEDGSPHA